jgi:hypothetical protein
VPVGRGRNLQLGDARGYLDVESVTEMIFPQLDIMDMYDVYVGLRTCSKRTENNMAWVRGSEQNKRELKGG